MINNFCYKKSILGSLVLLVLIFLLGCGGGNSLNAPKGTVCTKDYQPFEYELPNKPGNPSAKPIDIGDATDVPVGNYVYEGAEIFYFNAKENIRLHLQEVKELKNNSFKTSVICASGLRLSTKELHYSVTGVAGFTMVETRIHYGLINSIVAGNTLPRNFTLNLDDRFHLQLLTQEQKPTQDLPSKVFNDNDVSFNFYKLANGTASHQIRSQYIVGDGESITLLVKLSHSVPNTGTNKN
ncbi:MAG: hypothetical protein K1X29_00260 [Bdellovibrionales bacterium]|nr:hypothetical protein [Bdellovibrionales bacterium]